MVGGARLLMSVVVAVAVLVTGPAAAMAHRDTGALVEYPMVFPVDADHWYYDSFWEARPGGRTHEGIDIFADKGSEVRTVAAGVVLRVNGSYDSLAPEWCCSIVIRHDDGWESLYAHLNNDTPGTDDGLGWGIAEGLAPGHRVEAGQVIGYVGDSGNAEDTPSHIHLELDDPDGVAMNPFLALQAAGGDGSGGAREPLYAARQVVRFGDDGSHVRQLQEDLTRLGIDSGGADGAFGPLTERAVSDFQERYRLEADGLVGDVTRAALAGLLHAGDAVLAFGQTGEGVAETQRMLREAGVDPGPVDGDFGPRTLQAVLAFQRGQEIEVDGLVGPQTLGALSEG